MSIYHTIYSLSKSRGGQAPDRTHGHIVRCWSRAWLRKAGNISGDGHLAKDRATVAKNESVRRIRVIMAMTIKAFIQQVLVKRCFMQGFSVLVSTATVT
jgi:hypothetical protein